MGIESAGPSKKGKPFPPDQLAAFKEAVEGSDLTKAGLIEVLKKRYIPSVGFLSVTIY
jgi:hypothetical protein